MHVAANSIQLTDIIRNPELYVPFKAGQTIFTEGEMGDFMYMLFEGQVDVYIHGKLVGTFEPIEIFGEMAVIDPHPRSATVVAKSDCKLVRINQKKFILLIQERPQFAILIMRSLVERIRWMDDLTKEQAEQLKAMLANEQASEGEDADADAIEGADEETKPAGA